MAKITDHTIQKQAIDLGYLLHKGADQGCANAQNAKRLQTERSAMKAAMRALCALGHDWEPINPRTERCTRCDERRST